MFSRRLLDHLWAGMLVSLAMGVFLIGGGAYYGAGQGRSRAGGTTDFLQIYAALLDQRLGVASQDVFG